MSTIYRYYHLDDGSLHPLWLGMLILLSVIIISSCLCFLRIKWRSKRQDPFNRSSSIVDGKDERCSVDETQSRFYCGTRRSTNQTQETNDIPDFYTIFRHVNMNDVEDVFVEHNSTEGKEKMKSDLNSTTSSDGFDQHHHHHHRQVSMPSITSMSRRSEIARKFFASMRNSHEHPSSRSLDSYNSDISLESYCSPSINVQSTLNNERAVKINRSPGFRQAVPYTDGFALAP